MSLPPSESAPTEVESRGASRQLTQLLVRGASGAFVVTIAGAGLALVVQAILARLLGVRQYGAYIYVAAWLPVLALPARLGLDTAALRFVAAYSARREWGPLRGILRRAFGGTVAGGVALGGLMAVGLLAWRDPGAAELRSTFWIGLPLVVLMALIGVNQAALRALRHAVRGLLPEHLVRPAVLGLLVVAWALAAPASLTAVKAMACNVVATLAAVVLGGAWLRAAVPPEVRAAPPAYLDREWMSVALPLLFIQSMHVVFRQVDILMLGALAGTEAAGLYAPASRIAWFLTFGLGASNAVVAPLISELHSTRDHRELERIASLSARGVSAVTVALALALVLVGRRVLAIFGPEFTASYAPLLLLVVGQTVNALCGPVGFLLSMTGHHRLAARAVALAAVLNLALNAALIPVMGILGAATATCVTTILWNLIMLLMVRRHLGVNPTAFGPWRAR